MTDIHTEPRKRRGRAFWQAHVEAWQRLGGSQGDYCRKHQIAERLFSIWKNKLKKESSVQDADTATSVDFIPVSISSPSPANAPEPEAVSIHLPNGIYLQASLSSSGQDLAELVKNLVPIPC
jgi:hypothetical protein